MAVYNRMRNPIPSRGTGRQANARLIASRGQVANPNPGVTIPGVGIQPMPTSSSSPLGVNPISAPIAAPSQVSQQQGPLTAQQLLQPFMPGQQSPTGQQQQQSGGWLSGIRDALVGSPGSMDRFVPFSPTQQAAFEFILNNAISGLGNMDQNFDPIEQRARQQYQQQTVPGLAERFTALGGGQRSSAFAQNLGQSGADLESQLAALRSQYNMQRSGQLQSLLGLGLAPRYESIYQAGQPGFIPQFLGGLSSRLF